MEAILVRERYKLIRVMRTEEHYVCAEAVDILDREKRSCLLNIYDGPLLRRYLPRFENMEGCPAFGGMFLEGESLVTVFELSQGTSIDQIFYRGDKHLWRDRLDFADALLQQVLNLADLDVAVSCPALLAENVLVDGKDKRVRLRFQVVPMEEMTPREVVFLATDHLKKVLRSRFDSPAAELDFLKELDRGDCQTAVQLYALWRKRREALEQGYEALEKKNIFWRWLTLAWGRIKRLIRRR